MQCGVGFACLLRKVLGSFEETLMGGAALGKPPMGIEARWEGPGGLPKGADSAGQELARWMW